MRILFLITALFIGSAAHAEDYVLTLKDHKYTPDKLTVPAKTRVKIKVINQDDTPEEFEMHAISVEKVIPGHATGTVVLPPLEPGEYTFEGEYHEETALGTITVK